MSIVSTAQIYLYFLKVHVGMELCLSCLLSVDSSCFPACEVAYWVWLLFNCFCPQMCCVRGNCYWMQPALWRKRQRFKTSALHFTALGSALANWRNNTRYWASFCAMNMVHELKHWVHPAFNFASPVLQDFWFLLFLHVSMFVYSWLLIFWIWLNLIWHKQVILWWVHLKWDGGRN